MPHRMTLGLLTYTSRGPVWAGCVQAAQKHELNLIGFGSWWLDMPTDFQHQANKLFDLVSTRRLDGLIVWSSALATYVGAEAAARFCERFRTLPMVSLGLTLPGIPSIIVDEYSGMCDLVKHLVLTHGRRKPVLLLGSEQHPEMKTRLRAYRDTLRACGIGFRPEWVVIPETDHDELIGIETLSTLLDKRRVEFDSLICANGSAAASLVEAVYQRGLTLPDDVAVVSFGQSPESNTSLTCVNYPYFEQGSLAVDVLLAQIRGEASPERIVLKTWFSTGMSCGCRIASPAVDLHRGEMLDRTAATQRTIDEIEQIIGHLAEHFSADWAETLVEAFDVSIRKQQPDSFIFELERRLGRFVHHFRGGLVLQNTVMPAGDFSIWQSILSALRTYAERCTLMPEQTTQAETLLHQCRIVTTEFAQRAYLYQIMQTRESDVMAHTSQRLAATHDMNDLVAVLADRLATLDISSCFISLYRDESLNQASLVLAVQEQQRLPVPDEGLFFAPDELIPEDYFPTGRRYTWIIEALYFRERQQGFVIFEVAGLENLHTQTLRAQISAGIERARLYSQTEEARRTAEEANRLKSVFLSTVSHELRTPLALISGLSELMLDRTQSQLAPADARDLERIQASARHVDLLIRDVLDLASDQVGQLRLNTTPFDIGDMLYVIQLMGEHFAQEKGLNWETAMPESFPAIRGDRARLQQVILNLIANAVKFTERGSVRLEAEVTGDEIVIRVRDSGIGIPAHELPFIFDGFRRGDEAVARGFRGVGLGLAISKRLVELHQGTLHVESQPGRGSCFAVRLPILLLNVEEDAASAYWLPPLATAVGDGVASTRTDTILIVDDEPAILDMHARAIEERYPAFSIVRASGGQAAWSLLRKDPPRLVILDLMMVDVDGFRVMELMQTAETTRRIPIIVLTAQVLTQVEIGRLTRNVCAVLQKGIFGLDELQQHVEIALQQNRRLSREMQEIVRRTMAYIHEHFREDISREQLAGHVSVSERYLTRCFREEMGITPSTYLARYRILQAKRLLLETSASIGDVALEVGFSSASYFGQVFLQQVGVQPHIFRERGG
jgi:signal transduction histidine kinase/DNA-binding LacI/PurR family transcriptional regulator/AraC-like DNA-binding protein